MDRLNSIDAELFRYVNVGLKNWFFDWFMPFFNTNVLFVPLLALVAIWMTWKGGVRGRLFVCFMLLTFVIGDPLIVNSLKKFFARPRPFSVLTDIHLLVGRTNNPSMPSGHAANWFAAAVVAFIYYRRSVWFMLPMAVTVAFSRIYLGVHYPSDVVAGALIGSAYAILIVWISDATWRLVGRRWFPLWHAEVPSLIHPPDGTGMHSPDPAPQAAAMESDAADVAHSAAAAAANRSTTDTYWVRLAYLLIGGLLLGHLAYIAAGKIELSEDEAYQWLWSKHLAMSYFSKPPLIAYVQFLGTSLWDDTVLGIRFFAPVLGALTSLLLVRLLAREANGFVACASVLMASATPLLMVGATLMTIDCLSVLFWMAAVVTGWKAVRQDSTPAWMWTGLWMGLGFLSKYIALFQWLCWLVFFVLNSPARKQLRRPGPYLALLINLLCLAPVAAWNIQYEWITVAHLANRGGLDQGWQPTLRFLWDFIGAEAMLLNPVFFVGLGWAAFAFWPWRDRRVFWVYLFSMGAPLFLFYLSYTFRARVQPNWIAPAVLPLLSLMLVYWESRWRAGSHWVRHGLMAGLTLGWIVVVPLHDTRLIKKLIGTQLPVKLDPLTRVLGWEEMAKSVTQARMDLLAEGKPVFIIAGHYGTTSLLSFYIPEAKAGVPDNPLVYFISSDAPKNQFYFWPGYKARKGQNAIYIAPVDRNQTKPPPELEREFTSVTDLGFRDILHKGRVFHRIRLFACRDLR